MWSRTWSTRACGQLCRRSRNPSARHIGHGALHASLMALVTSWVQPRGASCRGSQQEETQQVHYARRSGRSWSSCASRHSLRRGSVQDLADHPRAIRTQCERAKRTLPSFTQASIELDGIGSSRFAEMNMDVSKGSVEWCDSGMDTLSAHDVVHVRGITRTPVAQKMIQYFVNWEQSIHVLDRALLKCIILLKNMVPNAVLENCVHEPSVLRLPPRRRRPILW